VKLWAERPRNFLFGITTEDRAFRIRVEKGWARTDGVAAMLFPRRVRAAAWLLSPQNPSIGRGTVPIGGGQTVVSMTAVAQAS
jgi:hypothetical protein